MASYDIYVFFLCFIVFSILTMIFTVMLVIMVRNYLRLVQHGLEDEKIKAEFDNEKTERKTGAKVLGWIFSAVTFGITAAVFVIFIVSAFSGAKETLKVGKIPALKVVVSGSMSYKHQENEYLFEKNLNNQLGTFDLVLLHQLPNESQLQQYDVVAYERDGKLILHRIINIEEPNEKHPGKRYFLLQGDAVEYHDKFPVLYEDMRGIYKNQRIPFIGSFFMFMQSPAGYLCILLIVITLVAAPITERKIKTEQRKRYEQLSASAENALSDSAETNA